jgi:hypothetical protein
MGDASPAQLRYLSTLCDKLKVPPPQAETFEEAGAVIDELKAEVEKRKKEKRLGPPSPAQLKCLTVVHKVAELDLPTTLGACSARAVRACRAHAVYACRALHFAR